MLDRLLDCNRYLPILTDVLTWAPPSTWVRLRCARQAFAEALCEKAMRDLVKGSKLSNYGSDHSLLGLIEAELRHDYCSLEKDGDPIVPDSGDSDHFEVMQKHRPVPDRPILASSLASSYEAYEVAACEVVFVGLLRGLDVNEEDPSTGIVPLMRAAEDGRWHLCHLLLSRRADANRLSIGRLTALGMALGNYCGHCLTSSRQWCKCPRQAVAQLLLTKTNVRLPEAFAATVRMALQDISYLEIVDSMVKEKGVSIQCTNSGAES
eukprot:TRINITY_DN12245_c0_g1_i2.p1 TRINITY_DN12245_c0_g1~~TRINITY_DN12245_c0_g1_i2.p1  ORF type:complete len:265 (+),score=47.61 TRINITY_DN12245_c0_g1_i2:24-818(+)